MLRMKDVMTAGPFTIETDQPLSLAASLMDRHAIRHLPVVRGSELMGVLSERDLWLLRAMAGMPADNCSVSQAMAAPAFTVDAEHPVVEAAREMADQKYGCAIVTSMGKVVGIATAVDLLRALSARLAVVEATAAKALARPAAERLS